MNEHSEETPDWEAQRNRIIGLGETSIRKSYYPELQQRIKELEKKNHELAAAYAEQTAVDEELRQQYEETRKKEQALRESEERFAAFMEHLPITAFIKDEQSTNIFVNRHMEEVFGAKKWIGKSVRGQFPPEAAERMIEDDRQTLKDGYRKTIENLVEKNGELRTFETCKFRIDRDNMSPLIGGFAMDITERKRAEDALYESEKKYRNIVETTPDLIWGIDVQGNFMYLSPQIFEVFGYRAEDLMGNPFFVLIPPDQIPVVTRAFEQQVTRSSPHVTIEVIARHADGHLMDMEIRSASATDGSGKLIGFRGITRDISERKEAGKALRISEERYRSLVDITDTGYLVIDNRGLVTDANDVYIHLTGRSSLADLVGRSVTEWTAPYDLERNAREVEKCLTTGQVRGLEIDYVKPDGTIQPIEINATVFHKADGHVILTLCRDISERKRTNIALQQARNKLNLLNAVTFQDIQTAAFSLSAYQELVKNMLTDQKAMSYVEKQGMFLKKMVDTLDFAKNYQDMGMHPPRWQNVRQVFLYAISHLDFLHIKQNLQLENLEIFADTLFEKTLFNIMENVLSHGVSATEVTIYYEEKTDHLTLFIEDNGVGIPTAEKNMIFDRGYGKGTGLGLFLVREVLSITGITIRETGVSGQGTRFEITVPKGMYRQDG